MDTQEIGEITFGIYSAEEIKSLSACKIDNPKKTGYNTVYDPRLGATDSSQTCETCNQNAILCPGHFGHIELVEPIVHPVYYKRVANFLSCFCMKCFRLIITQEQIYMNNLHKYKGETRFNKILEKIKKTDICCQPTGKKTADGLEVVCEKDHPIIKFNTGDSSYTMIYEEQKKKISVPLSVSEIFHIFNNVCDEDIKLLGFNPELSHPKHFIIRVLPVCPPCVRPYVKADGKTCDDDLTIQYCEIIKANNNLNKEISETERQKNIASLRFRIQTTFNNSQGKAKHTTNGRPIKGIKERLTGKNGQIRLNCQGRRCDQTGRTVIGPDPTLRLGELAFPEDMAKILTVPVKVVEFNKNALQDMVNKGLVRTIVKPDETTVVDLKRFRRGTRLFVGDIIIRGKDEILVEDVNTIILKGDQIKRNSEIITKIKPSNREYKLDIGWTVNRPLQDGDYVLLNRQPTLHSASMLAMCVIIRPHKTLRMNLAITKGFNADFDGDEMNIHVPASPEAQAELKMLSAAQFNIISPQSSKPIMAIVQDSLLGAYKMTQSTKQMSKGNYFNIAVKLPCAPWSKYKGYMTAPEILDQIQHIRRVLKSKGKKIQCYNGKGLVSLFLPRDFNYEKKNDKSEKEPVVRIQQGVLYEGVFDKSIIGSSHNAIHHILHKEYGESVAAYFLDCIQFATNNYLLVEGFTVGLGDCLISKESSEEGVSKRQEINDVIEKCYVEAEGIKETTIHPGIREIRINAALSKAKDVGLRIAKDALAKDNNFLSTVHSGSKGDFFNIAQITGLLGQQNLKGRRVPLSLNNGKRSLPHYPFGQLEPKMEYESRGFIDNGFLAGLNPKQFYFHAMSGREGICDTAMGTATSGYMQRRIIKLTEDIKIEYDGTVRDITGKIYQMVYGNNGINPTCTTKVNGSQQFCNVGRIVDKLNMKYSKKIK